MEKISIEQHIAAGGLGFILWAFPNRLLQLDFLRGVLALLLWPYYLGVALSKFIA